jgi:hypothetical protein
MRSSSVVSTGSKSTRSHSLFICQKKNPLEVARVKILKRSQVNDENLHPCMKNPFSTYVVMKKIMHNLFRTADIWADTADSTICLSGAPGY